MALTLEELEDRVTKRREVDMIVKMRIDQLQRESVFASSAALDAAVSAAKDAQAKVLELERRVAYLEQELNSRKR